ncbi:MAG: outer membrane beta-barrel protein [Pseudomonadota bacterium]|nr:outer membrane beta-barrel protein [Pseudomonadota bacterium]
MFLGVWRFFAASALFAVSLTAEVSEAAEAGFYAGAAGARSEQRLDEAAGVGPIFIVDVGVTPPGAGFQPFPVLRDPPFNYAPFPGNPVAIAAVQSNLTADETDVGWSVVLGYRVNKYLAAELSYMDAGEASLTERYSTPATYSFPDIVRTYTVSSSGPAVSVLGSVPLGEQWAVFLRGGVSFVKQAVESRVFADSPTAINGPPIKRDYSDEVANLGAGVQWTFLPRWTARLEYQRSDALQSNEIMGESRLDQVSLGVLFGL